MARTGGPGPAGISSFLVPAGTPGLSFGATEKKMGWNSQPTAAVFFDNVKVPAASRLAKEGDGFKIAMTGLDGGRLSIAACSLGAASAAISTTREYVKARKQFGAPIASQQAVAFKLADAAATLVASRAVVRQAAALLDAKAPTARAHCALAKRFATEHC
jgi:alkylation response protein AidB-like acyl-CoA dehydrogenase